MSMFDTIRTKFSMVLSFDHIGRKFPKVRSKEEIDCIMQQRREEILKRLTEEYMKASRENACSLENDETRDKEIMSRPIPEMLLRR